jgi:hypothetical protein
VVILPKERMQIRLEIRLNNIKSIFDKAKLRIANVFYLDEFVWQHCTPPSLHETDPLFSIRGFVEPSIDSPDHQGAVSFVTNWYYNHPTPILLIRGSGGIGKTTLAQEFSNYLIGKEKKKILFIDDDVISEYFLRSSDEFAEGFDVYQAYRALLAKSGGEVLSADRFFLNFNSGNFLLIIDGLDQVIARLGNRFKVNEFLASVYPTDNSQRRKAIFTCRAAFLPESYFSPHITTVDVLPFDKTQAEFFLSNRFPNMPKIVDRCLSLASSLTREMSSTHFYPFLLDIVANLIQSRLQSQVAISDTNEDADAAEPFASSILSASNDNDYIVYRVCAREQKKYPHGLTPDQQVRCLLSLAVIHGGGC